MNVTGTQQQEYLRELRAWLREQEETPLEEMSGFFSARLDGYEEHMAHWQADYQRFAQLFPAGAQEVLDLGCGTGLEVDALLARRPELRITGIDLCPDMLKRLNAKHPQVRALCADYFACDLGREQWDAVVSFESLHHFAPEKKAGLYRRVWQALRPGGVFMLCDYMACCEEEEALLRDTCLRRRAQEGVPAERFVHFDTPLTVPHEQALLRGAGFTCPPPAEGMSDAVLLMAVKE